MSRLSNGFRYLLAALFATFVVLKLVGGDTRGTLMESGQLRSAVIVAECAIAIGLLCGQALLAAVAAIAFAVIAICLAFLSPTPCGCTGALSLTVGMRLMVAGTTGMLASLVVLGLTSEGGLGVLPLRVGADQ